MNINNKIDVTLVFYYIFSLLMYKRIDEICKNESIYYLIFNLRLIIINGDCSLLNRTFIVNALNMIIKNIYFRPYRIINVSFNYGLKQLKLLINYLEKKYSIKK